MARDRTRGRNKAAELERERNIRAREESLRDEVDALCEENPDPTRPPRRIVQELAMPIKNIGEWVWKLTYRYPTIADMRAVQHLDEETEAITIIETLVRRLTPLKGESVSQMSAFDLEEAGRIIARFRERRPAPSKEEPS
jgi:hypothetical protein